MKYAIALMALLFTINAQAAVHCFLSSASQPAEETTYDRTLFSGEVTAPIYLIIKKGARTAEVVDIEKINTIEKWRAINGATMVTFSLHDNVYGITVGRVDLSQKKNVLPLEAMVNGRVSEKSPVSLVLPQKNLSALCMSF